MSILVRSVGSALPARAVKNDDLPASLETSDEWIKSRTGIGQRYLAGEGETTSTLAVAAARDALENAGLTAADIDGIIVGTITGDLVFPATACRVQAGLEARQAWAWDVSAACSGYVYALCAAAVILGVLRLQCELSLLSLW